MVSGAATFVHRDYMYQTFPVAEHWRASFWRGEIPLWNPYSNDGIPFLAQWSTLVLYPPSLVYLLLPSPWGLGFFCLAHLVLAGLAMYAVAAYQTGSRLAAGVAGAGYAFTGVLLATLHLPASLAVMAWAPLVLLWTERAWREGGRAIAVAGLVGGLQMLGGYPEFIVLTWLVVAVQAAGAMWRDALPLARTAGRLAAVVALVAGLCAAQLLPFLELFAHSHRDPAFGAASEHWAMPAWGLANLVVPLFRAQHSLHGVPFQPGQEYFSSYYPGIAVLALALVACWRVRGWRAFALAALAGAGLLLAMGSNARVYDWVTAAVPALGVARFPIKFVFAAALVLPILAAHGARAAQGRAAGGRRVELAVAAALVAVGAVLVALSRSAPAPAEPWTTALWSGISRGALLAGVLGILLGVGRLPGRARPAAGALAVALVALDGLSHAPGLNPTVPVAAYRPVTLHMPEPPALGEGRAMVSPASYDYFNRTGSPNLVRHFVGHRLALSGNLNLLERIPKVDGHYWVYLDGEWAVRSLLYRRADVFLPRLADFLAVSRISSAGDHFGWDVRATALPLATGGQAPRYAGPAETLAALAAPDFDPRAVVYLPEAARERLAVTGASAVRVSARRFGAHEIALDVEAEAPALVVVAQTHHAPWRAQVDGEPARIWRANRAFQAVEVPAGRHALRLVYTDRAFLGGAALSLATLAVCAAVWTLSGRRGRAPRPGTREGPG